MYDINISSTSIPSDIHLISSAPMFTLHQQDQQFYEQMFESLADVIGYQPNQRHQQQPLSQERQQPWSQQSCRSTYHQKLRNTQSTFATSSCNQDHLSQLYKLQSLRALESRLYNNNHFNQQQSQYNQQHPIAKFEQQKQSLSLDRTTPAPLNRLHQQQQQQQLQNCQPHYLTIEELKLTRNSCWLCGCNWREGHVSLDCPECDGYALTRPCPSCDGKCKQVWQRNITATHDKHRALWTGHCAFEVQNKQRNDDGSSDGDDLALANTNTATTTTTTTTIATPACDELPRGSSLSLNALSASHSSNNNAGVRQPSNYHLLVPSASSICSSQPSSVSSSDDEPDDFLSI